MQKNITQISKQYKELVSTGTVVTKKIGMFWNWAQHVSNNYIFTDGNTATTTRHFMYIRN